MSELRPGDEQSQPASTATSATPLQAAGPPSASSLPPPPPPPPSQQSSLSPLSSGGDGGAITTEAAPLGMTAAVLDEPFAANAPGTDETRATMLGLERTVQRSFDGLVMIREVVTWGNREVAALASAEAANAQHLADIHVRLALMTADLQEEGEAWAHHLPHIAAHPMGLGLLLSHGISTGQRESIQAAQAAIESSSADRVRRAAMLCNLAESWLYRFGDTTAATEVARTALEAALASPSPADHGAAWMRELRHVYMTALAADGQWRELGRLLTERATAPDADLGLVVETAHLLLDRLDDAKGAAVLLRRLSDPGVPMPRIMVGPAALHLYRALVIALEVAAVEPQATWLDALALQRQRLAMLHAVEGSGREAAAVHFLLAEHLRATDPAAAAEILAALAGAEGESSVFGPYLAALMGHQLAYSRGEWVQVVGYLNSLTSSGGAGPLSICHAWRAAEITDGRVGDAPAALEWWRAVAAEVPGNEQIDRAIERLLLSADAESLAAHLEELSHTVTGIGEGPADPRSEASRQAFAMRRAAAVAESRLGDFDRAVMLQAAAVESSSGPLDFEHLLRLHRRRGDREALIAAYRSSIERTRDPRSGTACLCAIGALEWSRGQLEAAEEAFAAAARQSPRDPVSRLALAALYRAMDRRRELVTVLARLVELIADQEIMVELLRELGQLYASEFNNTRRARELLERALAIDPNHAATLHGIAQLHDRVRQWDKAIELRRRALDVTAEPRSKAALWLEIGDIEETRRRDDAAALQAYEAAVAEDGTAVAALRAQSRLYRRTSRLDKLLDTLRTELALISEPLRQVEIQLEIASLTGEGSTGSRDSAASLEAYMSALAVDPSNETALAGVERMGRDRSRWDLVATAYRNAPRTAANLAILAEALRHQEAWQDLAEVLTQQLGALPAGPSVERGRLSSELAELYHRRLGNVERAAEMYRQAIASGIAMPEAQRALTHMLEEHERWTEVEHAYEQELAALPAHNRDRDRELTLRMRLGALRRDRLGRNAEAAQAYEEALELEPQHVPALEALAGLYERLEREDDLLRVLAAHAAATEDSGERCQIYKRTAEIKQNRGDIDGAVVAYRQAFEAQPANRAVFTDMEKLCYKHERWNDAMALYDTAIERVENGLHRAYRLGDLYARRGQVQLQYLKQLDKAAASFRRVIDVDPDNDTALKYLETIYTQTSDWPALVAAYEARAQLTRDAERRIDALRRAARTAGNKLKDPAESSRIYERILEADPADKEALDTLERFYERAKDWDKLVGVLKRRLDGAPAGDTATALLRRIAQVCEEKLRDPARAVENYRRILDIAPGNKDALEALGRIFESTEQWTEFIEVTRRQIRVTTDRNIKALLYFKCGSVMEAKFGKEEDAIRYYDAAIKTSPSCLPAVHGLRDLYRRREDWPRVIQTLELEVKLWQDKKERAGVSAQIGRIYAEHLGDAQRALHYFESALAIDPECLPANQALFEHYFANGEWERAKPLALSLAQKAMREGDPSARSDFYHKHGIVCRMTGDARTGAESLVIALEIKPTNQEALDALGELAKAFPDAYGFDLTYRELEKIYRKRDDAQALLARVQAAQAVMKERQGDLDSAMLLYEEAARMCPSDASILSALVDFHCNMRRWSQAVEAIDRFIDLTPPPPEDARIQAMMRQVEIYAECEMDPHRAIAVLREIMRLQPTYQEAHYCLAQEMYALHRFDEAQAAIDRAIELAAAPGAMVVPETLARYYFYRGRIMEVSGDNRKATSQYRRAAEYDPGYAPPALALARRAAESGDQHQAETLLIDAAHAAMERGGVEAAVPLQRGLARILLASGDRKAAIEAYRGILNVQPDGAADRVALAEIYAVDDLPKAITELSKNIVRDTRHAPTYHLLARLYAQSGEFERAKRVLAVLAVLGFSEDERGAGNELRNERVAMLQPMNDELRQQLMVTEAALGPVGEIFSTIAADVSALFPQPAMGENLVPIQTSDDLALKTILAEMMRLYCVEPEVYVGERVPGGVVLLAYPRRIVVLDRELLAESDLSKRFIFGWAFEAIRGGYALLFGLTERQRSELGALMISLLAAESDRAAPTNEFIQSLPKKAVKVIERYAGQGHPVDIEAWVDGMQAIAKRSGLFGCDDLEAAVRMIAILNGERLELGYAAIAGLGAVLGGSDLIRFYLSDEYHRLREILSNPMATTGI